MKENFQQTVWEINLTKTVVLSLITVTSILAAIIFIIIKSGSTIQSLVKVNQATNPLITISGIFDYIDFFIFISLSISLIAWLKFFVLKEKHLVVINKEKDNNYSALKKAVQNTSGTFPLKISTILFSVIIVGFIINQLIMNKLGLLGQVTLTQKTTNVQNEISKPVTKLTSSGNSLDQTSKSYQTSLGSQHIHADMKVYINGQALDFAQPQYYMKSSLLHLDYNQNKEDASSVLHMHAKKIPLWLFFRSLGMRLEKDSFTNANGQVFKNESSSSDSQNKKGNTLKFYLNGQKVTSLRDYSFQPQDKILISYGPENDSSIQNQIDSVTSFAKDHK